LQNFANPRADHMALMQQLGFDLNAWLHRLVTRSSTPCLRVPDLAIALRSLERYVSVAGGDAIRLRGIPRRRRHRRQRKQLLQLLVALCHACDRGPPTSSPSVVASEVALLLATALRERQVALESLERLRTHQADHTAPQTSGARTDLASSVCSVYYTALRQCVFQWLFWLLAVCVDYVAHWRHAVVIFRLVDKESHDTELARFASAVAESSETAPLK
jgi:hypothetical protein